MVSRLRIPSELLERVDRKLCSKLVQSWLNLAVITLPSAFYAPLVGRFPDRDRRECGPPRNPRPVVRQRRRRLPAIFIMPVGQAFRRLTGAAIEFLTAQTANLRANIPGFVAEIEITDQRLRVTSHDPGVAPDHGPRRTMQNQAAQSRGEKECPALAVGLSVVGRFRVRSGRRADQDLKGGIQLRRMDRIRLQVQPKRTHINQTQRFVATLPQFHDSTKRGAVLQAAFAQGRVAILLQRFVGTSILDFAEQLSPPDGSPRVIPSDRGHAASNFHRRRADRCAR